MDAAVLTKLESDWKAGLMSPRLLAIRYQMPIEAIQDVAAKRQWGAHASLRDQIDHKATKALIDRTVAEAGNNVPGDQVLVSDGEQIDAYAQILSGVLQEQRDDIKRGRAFAGRLLRELEEASPPEIDQEAITAMADAVSDTHPELAQQLRQNVGPRTFAERMGHLGKRISMLGNLASTQETYIGLERVAWGMNATVDAGAQGNGNNDALIDLARKEVEARE